MKKNALLIFCQSCCLLCYPFLLLTMQTCNLQGIIWYMMIYLSCTSFFTLMEIAGAARGCGWQKFCSYVNLGAYYAVGIPSAVILAFFLHIGGKVVYSLINSCLVVCISLKVFSFHIDIFLRDYFRDFGWESSVQCLFKYLF